MVREAALGGSGCFQALGGGVPIKMGATGLFMLLERSNAVISHQVANYGMGGQYEPHFDFSRVRPTSSALSKGPALAALRRLEILGALQPPHHPTPTSCLTGETLHYW
jgi:hypothetical protein